MKQQRKRKGFSLIELMIAMAVLLIIVGALVVSGGRALRAANESSAAQNVSSLASDEQAFQHGNQGYSPLATNLGGSEVQSTVAATFAADQEVPTALAAKLDAGATNGGYTIIYKAGPTTFVNDAGNTVATTFEFTSIPNSINSGTKAWCSDPSGTWSNNLGTGATPASGAGCKTDGFLNQ
jgi:prepilin-type N-terminal cleavage/methylation domain-containing protein